MRMPGASNNIMGINSTWGSTRINHLNDEATASSNLGSSNNLVHQQAMSSTSSFTTMPLPGSGSNTVHGSVAIVASNSASAVGGNPNKSAWPVRLL